jgi:8-oxo-dGTP pyrophosphatase MutT (NUDIX family)
MTDTSDKEIDDPKDPSNYCSNDNTILSPREIAFKMNFIGSVLLESIDSCTDYQPVSKLEDIDMEERLERETNRNVNRDGIEEVNGVNDMNNMNNTDSRPSGRPYSKWAYHHANRFQHFTNFQQHPYRNNHPHFNGGKFHYNGARYSVFNPAVGGSNYAYNSSLLNKNEKRCGIIFVDAGNATSPGSEVSPGQVSEEDACKNVSFLVVRGRVSNIWSFAKGRIKAGEESDEECALREVYEETGIKLDTVAGMPKIIIGRNVYFICHTTRQQFSSFTIHDNYEVGEVAWKTSDELRKLSANKDVRAVLRYPGHVLPYHQVIYNPPKIPRAKYSFKDIVKFMDLNIDPVEVC